MIHHPTIVNLIYEQHKRQPLAGRVVMIGWQTITMTVAQTFAAMTEAGLVPRAGVEVFIDRHTEQGKRKHWIDAEPFFKLLADVEVMALDVSTYEGAQILHDLNYPLPESLRQSADFVLDGSCLDNLFDPACAMRCMGALLKPGGRWLSYESGCANGDPYIMFTADWFRDWLEANSYADIDVRNYYYEDVFGVWQPDIPTPRHVVLAQARKTEHSSDNVAPIQVGYRG